MKSSMILSLPSWNKSESTFKLVKVLGSVVKSFFQNFFFFIFFYQLTPINYQKAPITEKLQPDSDFFYPFFYINFQIQINLKKRQLKYSHS